MAKKERRSSVVSALVSIGRAAKKQLTPKSKSKKGRGSRHRRHSRDDSASSSESSSKQNIPPTPKSTSKKDTGSRRLQSSSDGSSYSDSRISSSDLSGSEDDLASTGSAEESKLERHSRRRNTHRRHRSREERRHRDKSRKRTPRRDHHSPASHGDRTPQRHLKNSIIVVDDDSAQMINLLMGILPFYGKGDSHSDSVVIDTIHKLSPRALEMQDADGNTLLLLACQASAYDLLPILLSKGCNVNTRNKLGATCLHFACFVDTFAPDAAMVLIRHGAVAEVAEIEFGCTPLHWAAFSGDVELCATLCRAGANTTTLDKNGCDPIHYSKRNGHAACALLLESFSKPKIGGVNSPSADAAHATSPSISSGNREWVRCLDGSTGSSFYNNRDTGESLWGDDFRKVDLQARDPSVVDIKTPPRVDPYDAKADELEEVIDHINVRHVPASCMPGKQPPNALSVVAEDLVEVSSNESFESNADKSQRSPEKDLVHHFVETSGVSSPPNSSLAPAVHSSTSDSNAILAMNQSFEERISSLHQKMESQLMHRLQHLEEKMAQQNLEISTKAADDSSRMKANISEMVSTVLKLQTEIGTKDLEILSLRQKLVKLETEKISKPVCVNANVGDGDIHDDGMRAKNDEFLAVIACREHELDDARNEILRLMKLLGESTKALSIATGQVEEAKRHLESAEKLALKEQASHSFTKNLLEQAKKGGEVDSALTLSMQEGKHQAEKTIVQLKEQLRLFESNLVEERISLTNKFSTEQSKATKLAEELEKTDALHSLSIAELNNHHRRELEQLKEERNRMNSELAGAQDKLKGAKMTALELMVSKDEAVHAMENAMLKARSSESKLQEMTAFISKTNELKEANDRLYVSLHDETEKRKVLHNTLEDMKGRIRVYVRVRPLSATEVKADYKSVLTKEGERTCVMEADAATASDVRDWEFDKVFLGSDANGNNQEAVFKDTSLLITSAIDGFNVCIFAYGQTGSGKTYTMLGSDGAEGLAPRLAHELFRKLMERESSHHVEVSVSILELYLDKLRDLLVTDRCESELLDDLKIHLADHTSSGLVEVEGARIERVANARELLDVFDRGAKGRASSSTKMNAASSRSHMIATIVLLLRNRRNGEIMHGKLTLVDLAGSERVSKSGAAGQELKEAQSINKSLSALGDVIGALTSGCNQHVPYRNNPLTMLMSDSIGGNAKTLMFVCCSPADYNRRETANSLDFAKRCRNVTNNVATSGAKSSASQIKALKAELSKIAESSAVKRPAMGMRRPGI